MSDDTIDRYPWSTEIATRWMDNDVYGHVNNAVYYSYFDTAANRYLVHECGLDIERAPAIALVVESTCTYRRPVAFPDTLRAGVRIDRLGRSSITWGIAIFDAHAPAPAAHGRFVHVFVDRGSRTSVEIPAQMRAALVRLT